MGRFDPHIHTTLSNLRLLDCINNPEAIIDKAVEMGLSGIAITDHEALCAHAKCNFHSEKYPDFTVALGNEIYLTETREKGQKYYHFILIAKNKEGYIQLRELSSNSWLNAYSDRGYERVPTLKQELKDIVLKNPGNLIATSACLGGELSTLVLRLCQLESSHADFETIIGVKREIEDFIKFCLELFKDDFYIEVAPGCSEEQVTVNKRLKEIAAYYGVKIVIGSDAHFMQKTDRYVHKAYLNSREGEREVDAFYEYSYLQTNEEIYEHLSKSFDKNYIDELIINSEEINSKITSYSLRHKQKIPKVSVKNYPQSLAHFGVNNGLRDDLGSNYPTIHSLLLSDEIQERYWINEVLDGLMNMGKFNDDKYLARIEEEANVIKFIGEQLEDCLFAYFNTLQHYINLFWECGSIVGPGRGSATGYLSNYCLGITQLDPIRWSLPEWRFLNRERAELPDIDIDLAPSVRPSIFEKIREERGELGLIQVSAFKTESTKSAILTSCRGYRSEEYPSGIDVDVAQYISSLIEQERGFIYSLSDTIYGNKEKGRKPNKTFLKEVSNYPGLLDIMISIEGIICGRSSHASGVILYDDNIYETSAIMRTPSGDLVTQFDLHDAEAAGDTKYDFLVTEISDKLIQAVKMLQTYNELPQDKNLREIYNEYFHPEVLNLEDKKIWEAVGNGEVLDIFQFCTGVGLAIAKKLKPQNITQMMAASAMMRLMSEQGKESQQDRFYRIQQEGLDVFEDEMVSAGINPLMRAAMHKHCDIYYGCVPMQEQMMKILMDPDIANFTLGEANAARKIVAKKQMDKIPELREKVFGAIPDMGEASYIWETAIAPSLGYAFSENHSLPYSFVGVQNAYLATRWNPIFWNTACLIVNSGAVDPDKGDTTKYDKIAKAIGDIRGSGIKVSLADINKSDFGFIPDLENNEILFGLKAIANIGDDLVQNIIANRPYTGFDDFMQKVKVNKTAAISLIKAGAFDKFEERRHLLARYVYKTSDLKSRLTLQNFNGLIQMNLIPEDLSFEKSVFNFNKYIKGKCKVGDNYVFDQNAQQFFLEHFDGVKIMPDGRYGVNVAAWEKIYKKKMDKVREWLSTSQKELLNQMNGATFLENWKKYAGKGNISKWEMESLSFYYHEHELSNLDDEKYGVMNFFDLNEEPDIEYTMIRREAIIPIYKIYKIAGTCIAKNKNKSTISLLTNDGVVNVKFRKEYFSLFDKQISEKQFDGKKKVMEKSWFTRGNMLLIQGIRRGDDFVAKKYNATGGHQLYKILDIDEFGDITLQEERYKGEYEDEPA